MTSLLVNHILQTEKWTSPELFETKNRIYTFLNPVSYLIALENLKSATIIQYTIKGRFMSR